MFLIGLSLILFVSGFFFYVSNVTNSHIPDPLPKADGIVVLTGKGGGRLETAGKLLEGDYGERLLVSGAGDGISKDSILALLKTSPEKAACCIDIDRARDTRGNARETAIWVEALGFEHIILVTSAYHMPRAESEISRATGHIKITPYPVSGDQDQFWWRSRTLRMRLFQEYGKLLFSYFARPSHPHAHRAPDLEPPKDIATD